MVPSRRPRRCVALTDPPTLPTGPTLPDWEPRPRPDRTTLEGRFTRLEPLDPDAHASDLFVAYVAASEHAWTYLPYGPFPSEADFRHWLDGVATSEDPQFYAVVEAEDRPDGTAGGVASYLRIQPEVGSIEVGHIHFAPSLQRTRSATEAMYLMMRYAFDTLGYRRYEWKCDALHAASRRAAERLGFTYEGTHRQATIYKGRNRDTAWFSIVDTEWPGVRAALEAGLDPSNFDETGAQKRPLATRT